LIPRVYFGIDCETGDHVAIKVIEKEQAQKLGLLNNIDREVRRDLSTLEEIVTKRLFLLIRSK